MKSLLLATMTLSSLAFASPADKCTDEANKSVAQAVESRFEGNETFAPEPAKITTSDFDNGFQVVADQKTIDHHRGAGVDLYSMIRVSIVFDKECGEQSR